jgi:hypothetical protein
MPSDAASTATSPIVIPGANPALARWLELIDLPKRGGPARE